MLNVRSLSKRTIQIAFGSAIAVLLIVGAFSYRSIVVSDESTRWVEHTRDVLKNIQQMRYSMETVASNIRDFALTGKESYLDNYRTGMADVEQYAQVVRDLTVDNPGQHARSSTLDGLIAERSSSAEVVIDAGRTQGTEAAVEAVRAGPALRISADFQATVLQMLDEEDNLLGLRNADAARRLNQTKIILIAGILLGLLITGAAGWNVQRDNTRRELVEKALLQKMDELNRSNEELGQFAYIASHDLQEPLRMVASYTQLLSRRYKGKLDTDADEFIAYAVDGATRMQRLIQDLLAYSRVGTKGKELLNTSSEHALQTALSNLRGAIEDSGALITHDPLPNVLADETQLVQLFQNLVGNAIKYQNPGIPKIHVAALNGGEQYRFSVKDNGLGIDPKYFERIFGMFQRLHRREEFAGTGIGLAICKKIVERHGGQISVESQPGQGSTFRFALSGSDKK
jgi:signal transduction histidine kinase